MAREWFDQQLAAEALLQRFGDEAERSGRPIFLALRPDGGGWFESEQVDRPGGLLGHDVDEEWTAVGSVATGRFVRVDPAAELPAAMIPGLLGGLRLACVLTRDDELGWSLELPDGTPWEPVPEEGFMLDILRRSLQLPTAPPTTSVAEVHVIGWLLVTLSLALERGTRLSWSDVLDLHRMGCGYPAGNEWDHQHFLEQMRAGPSWNDLRLKAASGQANSTLAGPFVPPSELAAWMDAGMFSRWVVRELPAIDQLMRDLRTRLQSAAYRGLCRLVHDLDGIADVA